MKDLLKVLNETFLKSSISDFQNYLNQFPDARNYILVSDYCVGDINKINDVLSFVIIPNIQGFFTYKEIIKNIIPKDLKKTREIKPETIAFLQSGLIFSINIILPKGQSRLIQGINKDNLIDSNQATLDMIDNWIKNEPYKADSYNELKQRYVVFKQELNKSNFNVNLYMKSFLLATLSAYFTHQIVKYSNAKEIIWFSDRDNMTTANNSIIYEDYSMQYNGIFRNDPDFKKPEGKLSLGISSTSDDCWYDEIVRLPDYYAGSFASFDFINSSNIADKHKLVINSAYKNSVNIILRQEVENGNRCFYASRLRIKKRT